MSTCPKCGHEYDLLHYGGWTLDVAKRLIKERTKVIFTASEVRILTRLFAAEGKPVAREELSEHNWQVVNVRIYNIRKKIPELIGTIHKQGYFIQEREKA
jgi:DNA-binding response OmpR family regulator